MRSFRRSPGAEHLVHAVELPELSRRRPVAARNGVRYVQGATVAGRAAPAAGRAAPAAGQAGPGHGANGVDRFLARRAAADSAALVHGLPHTGAELRQLDVPRPPPVGAKVPVAVARSTSSDVAPEAGRIELLERRLAKLARLLEERDGELQLRIEGAAQVQGVASIYNDVQGLRGQSEEAQRKRELMSSIFDANRKLRERIGSMGPATE